MKRLSDFSHAGGPPPKDKVKTINRNTEGSRGQASEGAEGFSEDKAGRAYSCMGMTFRFRDPPP